MADNNNNKKPELTNSIALDKENNDLEENLESENQPPQETSVTSISDETETEEGTYPTPTEKETYPPEKLYPEQPLEEPQINLGQPEQTTTLIPNISPTELPTDPVTTIAREEEGKFIERVIEGGVTAQHEQ